MVRGIKMNDRWTKFVLKLKEKFFFTVIYHGFVYIIPLLQVGATACALLNLPIRGYQDFLATESIKKLLEPLKIRLIDHIAIVEGDYVSCVSVR